MKKAILCLVPAIILACQEQPTILTNIGAITFGVLAIYYIVSNDKEEISK